MSKTYTPLRASASPRENSEKPALVPKLRFPEFQDSEGWQSKFLGDLCKIRTGKKDANEGATDGQYPFFTCAENHIFSHTYSFDAEAILIAGNANVGQTRYYRGKFEAYQRTYVLTDFSGIDVPYLYSILNAKLRESLLEQVQVSAMSYIKLPMLQEYALPVPPSPAEQQKIAECLSSVDDLMAAQARKVDALKTHKKGLMQQLFPREGETQPRLRFPEFQNAGEWEEAPLSKFILSLDAGVSVNSGDSRPASKSEFGVLKTSAITKGQFEPEENKVVLAEDELSRLREPVTGGTIIMCRKNTPALVGSNAYVESSHENLFLPDLLWAAKPREGVSMRFLAFILGADKGRAALTTLARGSSASMSNISKPEVLAFTVMAPSSAEQQRIAECLSSLDALITAETQKHEALKTHKKGLMQQLFPAAELNQ